MKRVEVVTNLQGPTRRQMFMGREHIAVPAVLVRSQVLSNNLGRTYLPPEDITPEWAETANGAPAVSDHPSISARNRDVLNTMGIGFLFDVEARDGALHAEVLLDPARAGDVPDLRAILAKLEKGEPVEVSTGFPVAIDEKPGAVNGEEYDLVIHPAGFDHLAVFAEKIGACSVGDGCGLAQNHDGPCDVEDDVEEETEGKLATAVNRLMALLNGPEDEAEEADEDAATDTHEEDSMNREQLIAQLADAGPLDEQALNKLSDCQLKALDGADGSSKAAEADNESGGDSEAWKIAHKYRKEAQELREQYEPAANEQEKRRAAMMDDLLFHGEGLPYSEEEIKAMSLSEMEKVYKLAFPQRTNFSGRGGPASTNSVGAGFDFVKSIMDGPAGSSVLDREEAN